MPYDSQGRWIEENEWQQMMREQAARRVGAFSRYDTPVPSVYPYQAAPYGSFGVTPSVGPYPTSPFMRRQEPAVLPWMDLNDPGQKKPGIQDKNFEWSFMKDPIALNETLSKPSFTEPLNVLNQEATGTITPTEDVNLAGMPFAGAITGANELINKAPFVSANPLSVLAKTEMLPSIFNYDAGPVVQNVFDTIMPTADAYVPPTNVDYPPELDPNRLDPARNERWLDWQNAQNASGMTPAQLNAAMAPETPAAYTGELDRYGLSGWTPEVPDPRHPVDFWGKGVDYVGDLISDTFDNPTLDKIYDVITWKPTLPTGILDKPMMDRLKKEAIIEKAKTAPKGNLERIAAQREEQAAAAAAARRDEQQANRRAVQRKAMEERKAAAAQRKADLAAQKAAARRTALARQALKDSQAAAAKAQAASAAQAKSEQAKAKAVLARMSNDRNTPSQAEINAAIEVMSQVDTFGGGSLGLDGGGFDPQGGTTGSSGMGDWT